MAKALSLIGVVSLLLLAVGCDLPERVSKLEKQNQDLQAEVGKIHAASDLDLQAKCSKDANGWFKENWEPRDKNTITLDYTNHYNKKLNKCFIVVEYHYNSNFAGPGGTSWSNLMSLTDVYENSKYGDFAENHYSYFKPSYTATDEVITCDMLGQKCKTIDEFNGLVRPFMND